MPGQPYGGACAGTGEVIGAELPVSQPVGREMKTAGPGGSWVACPGRSGYENWRVAAPDARGRGW